MLEKLTKKFTRTRAKEQARAQLIPKEQHRIQKQQIHPNAILVLEHLQKNGYQAYLVGGAIRDLLTGIIPKDFDIATNATPEEIQAIFKNSRIIGRRFRLVHVYFGRNIIEVSTFRGEHKSPSIPKSRHSLKKNNRSLISENGQLLRDNVYGSMEEDAFRRDFTINALYYSIQDEMIYDLVDGLNDIRTGCIRLLGDPVQRYQEDPVRMLRALRFSAKLKFPMESSTERAISTCAQAILEVSNARLFDELIKIFHDIEALKIIQAMKTHGLLQCIFPRYEENLKLYPWSKVLFIKAIENTVERIKQNKPVTIAYIYSVLLWPEFVKQTHLKTTSRIHYPHLGEQALAVIKEQSKITAISKQYAFIIKDIWEYQFRLNQRSPKKAFWLLQQRRFRAAFDFLLLRENSGEIEPGLGEWWQHFQFANEQEQIAILNKLPENQNPTQKRRKSYHKKRKKSKTHNE